MKIPSEFVPLDVNYAHDPAIREAGPMAELMFIRGMAYSRRTKSAGFIPDYDLVVVAAGIPNPKKHAQNLVRVALWVRVDRGYTVRSWAKWNPSTTKEVKAKQSEGGVRGNHNRWHVNGLTSDDCPLCPSPTDRSTDRSTDQSQIGMKRSVSDRLAITEEEVEEEREKDSSSPIADAIHDQQPRDDVEAVCKRLADGIESNGARRPSITKGWRDAARLLIDRDGYTLEQINWLIDWTVNDEFWKANVLSMPTFRKKFDQLRLKAMAGRTAAAPRTAPRDQWMVR